MSGLSGLSFPSATFIRIGVVLEKYMQEPAQVCACMSAKELNVSDTGVQNLPFAGDQAHAELDCLSLGKL